MFAVCVPRPAAAAPSPTSVTRTPSAGMPLPAAPSLKVGSLTVPDRWTTQVFGRVGCSVALIRLFAAWSSATVGGRPST